MIPNRITRCMSRPNWLTAARWPLLTFIAALAIAANLAAVGCGSDQLSVPVEEGISFYSSWERRTLADIVSQEVLDRLLHGEQPYVKAALSVVDDIGQEIETSIREMLEFDITEQSISQR